MLSIHFNFSFSYISIYVFFFAYVSNDIEIINVHIQKLVGEYDRDGQCPYLLLKTHGLLRIKG